MADDDNKDTSAENNSDNNNPKKSKRKKLIQIGLLTFLLIAIITGIIYYINSLQYQSTDDAFIDGHIIQIAPRVSGVIKSVYITDNQRVNKGKLLVELDPRDYRVKLDQAQADLQTALAGKKTANINVNLTRQTSIAGVEQAASGIDYSRSQIETAKEQIDLNKAVVIEADTGIKIAQASLEQTQAQNTATQQQLALANSDVNRYNLLFSKQLISKQQMDNTILKQAQAEANLKALQKGIIKARLEVQSAKSQKLAAQQNLDKARAQYNQALAQLGQSVGAFNEANTAGQKIGISTSQVEQSNAQIKLLQAKVQQAALDLSYTRIYAPTNGYITKRAVEKGAYFHIGQPLFAIVPTNVWVTANFKENQIAAMKRGMPVKIKVDSYPNKTFNGKIDSIQRGTGSRFSLIPPENAVGSYVKIVQRIPVKIIFDDPDTKAYLLAPGMSVVPRVKVK